MEAIEQEFPQSEDFKPQHQSPSLSPPDLTLNRDQEDSRPADDHALKQILTLELQNMVLKEVVDAGILNLAWEEGEQKAVDEDGELKRAIGQELYHLVLKQTINEAIESKSEGQALSQFIDEAALSNDCKRNGVVKEMDHEFGDSVKARVFGENENVYSVKDGIGLDGWNGGTEEEEKKERDELDGWNSGTEEEEKKKRDELDGWNSGIEERKKEREEFDEWNGGIEEGKREELEYESVYHVGEDSGAVGVQEDAKSSSYHYPLRPDAEDCSFYMRTGACKFGSNCKFNHPFKRTNQMFKQTPRQKDENSDRQGQTECKYYLSSGGCKYGKACKFSHTRGRPAVTPIAEFNFLGLPIRKGEKECPFYMRTGSCKYGSNCRFNHPDPTAVGGDSPVGYGNGGSSSLPGPPQTTMSSWSPRPLNEPTPYVPIMYSPPTQGIPPPNPEWNGYQAPVYPTSERSLPTPPAFALNNTASDTSLYMHHQQQMLAGDFPDTSLYTHHQQQMLVGDFPERPGQPECSYFLKTGDCKYRSSCKFHHPKSRITKTSPSVLSDKGLPLRPDQNICSNYSRYGICKYGPSCKYDHPVNYLNPAFAGGESGLRTGGSGSGMGRDSMIQQPVL